MPNENDTPLTEEELALAREGEALISAATADVHAPQSLREAIERERERATARARAPFWRRHRWGLAAAGAAAAALAVVAIALQTGGTTEPSFTNVYEAARLAPTEAAPPSLGGDPPVLDAKVGNLEFPDWQKKFGWEAVGRRDDTVSGRPSRPSSIATPTGRSSATRSSPASPSAAIRPVARSSTRARPTTSTGWASARSSPGRRTATAA